MPNVLFCVAVIFLALSGCEAKSPEKESAVPMLQGVSGGPWPIETYLGEKVQIENAHLTEDGVMEKTAMTVYLDSNSRFVLRDGAPIKTIKGDEIYWNAGGKIITKDLKRVQESSVFSVQQRPMRTGTAMVVMISPEKELKPKELKPDVDSVPPNAYKQKDGVSK